MSRDERLIVITGPMFSGKSTETAREMSIRSQYTTVLGVNTNTDIRYGDEGIITHDGVVKKSIRVGKLSELHNNSKYQLAQVIAIDEGNHYDDLYSFIKEELSNTDKIFIVAGLLTTANQEFFGDFYKLLALADRIVHLKAICSRCANGTPAPFTISKVFLLGDKNIGGTDTYESVCRKHITQHN